MASDALITYIKENREKYGIDAIRDVLIAQGYPLDVVHEAIDAASQSSQQTIESNHSPNINSFHPGQTTISPNASFKASTLPSETGPKLLTPTSTGAIPKHHYFVKLFGAFLFVAIILAIVVLVVGNYIVRPITQNPESFLAARSLPMNLGGSIQWQTLASFAPEELSGWTGGSLRGDTTKGDQSIEFSDDKPVYSTVERSYRNAAGGYVKVVINDLKMREQESKFTVIPPTGFIPVKALKIREGRFEVILSSRQVSIEEMMVFAQNMNLDGLKALP